MSVGLLPDGIMEVKNGTFSWAPSYYYQTSQRKIVLMDLDGVAFDFIGGLGRLLWETKRLPTAYHTKEWDLEKAYGIPEKDIWELIDNTPNFWANLQEEEVGALVHLTELENKCPDLSIVFITSRNVGRFKTAKQQTIDCFKKHGYQDPRIIWDRNKGAWCKTLDAALILDDKPSNLEDAALTSGCTTVRYICDQPYNKEYKNATRVSGIHELIPIIEELFVPSCKITATPWWSSEYHLE